MVPFVVAPSVDLMRRSASSRRMATKGRKKANAGPECRVSADPVICCSGPCLWWRGRGRGRFPLGSMHPPAEWDCTGTGFQLFAHPGAWYRFSCCLSSSKDPGHVLRRAIRIDRSDYVDLTASRVQRPPTTTPTGDGQTAGAVGKFDGRAGILTLSSSARACGHQTESGLAQACSLPMGGTREGLAWSIAIPSTGID